MFEHRSDPLLTRALWFWRLIRFTTTAAAIVAGALGLGMLGYHYLAGLGWLDAALNATMILTGMGPVDRPDTPEGKLFAIAYALFSGIVFLGTSAILVAPWLHRLLHRLHVDEDDDELTG